MQLLFTLHFKRCDDLHSGKCGYSFEKAYEVTLHLPGMLKMRVWKGNRHALENSFHELSMKQNTHVKIQTMYNATIYTEVVVVSDFKILGSAKP